MAINERKFSITKENIISFVANLIHVPCFRLGRVTTELWWKLEKSELRVIWLKAEFLPWFLLISLTLRRPEGLFWARQFWRLSQENKSKEAKNSSINLIDFSWSSNRSLLKFILFFLPGLNLWLTYGQTWHRGSHTNEFRNLTTVKFTGIMTSYSL